MTPALHSARTTLTIWILVGMGLALLATDLHAQTRIEGRVVDPQQRPVAEATVVAVGERGASWSATTDAAGRFVIEPLADGHYDITVASPGLIGEVRDVSAGGPSVDISLRVSAITETLVVSASHVDLPLSRTSDAITVTTGADITARQLTSLGDVLSTVPGFSVGRSGGPGTLTSLFPRGGESDYTLVLIDGVRANAFGGGIDLSQVPIEDVERVEAVRGPQSAVFGSDAIGGVVQIITRRDGVPSVRGRLETGSRSTRRVVGATTGSRNNWSWQAGADYFEDEGFTGTAPANGEHVTNDDAREAQGWIGTGFQLTSGTDLRTSLRLLDTERGAPGPFGSNPAGNFFGVDHVSRQTTDRFAFHTRVLHPFGGPGGRIRQRVEFDVSDYDLEFTTPPLDPTHGETRRLHARVQTDAALAASVSASAGVEWLDERARSTFIVAGRTGIDDYEIPVDRRVVGGFGEVRWSTNRLSIQGGARAEIITREPLAANPADFGGRPEFPADTVVSVNPKVALSWLAVGDLPGTGARPWTRVHTSAGTGIRPADMFEIAFTDNPGLAPERSKSVDAGVTQAFAGARALIDATMFFNEYDDLIVAVGSLQGVSRFRTDNISNARARGLELSGTWRATQSLELRATYTHLDTEILSLDGLRAQAPAPFRVGDRLLRRPTHHGTLDVMWTGSRALIFTRLQTRGRVLDAEPNFGTFGGLFMSEGYTVADAGASMKIVRGVEVYGRVLNLFDRDYEEVLGFPAPGRTAFVGVRLAATR